MALGRYDFWAMRDGKELFAYGATARADGDVMLDYLAVCRGRRGQGHGTHMLALLEQEFADKAVFIEVEDPETSCSDGERQIRLRRLRFYQRAGFRDSGVRCNVYGVDFMILLKGPKMCESEAQRRLDRIYRAVFTPKAYAGHIRYTGHSR
ncbi:MAG: GNAT family N-acetyltransferase [Oscillospiraceae bacterium]|nr:GNAT family N-acetyltransferase [Oscillospiraceae bacterium]